MINHHPHWTYATDFINYVEQDNKIIQSTYPFKTRS